ncbi:MAG: phosphatidylserine decarboxylase family protein [bacterium]
MSREGFGIIIGMILSSGIVTTGAILTPHLHLTILAIIGLTLTGFIIYFFRDPERSIPMDSNIILSPADGQVIEIRDEVEKEYLNLPTTRISIFLSLFDVHVNRIPMSGQIGHFRYQRGSFVKAYKKEASEINEQTIIGIENEEHKILFKQIAGILARRIVCNIREGNVVKQGERFGMIKFGSRVDIFLPKNIEIKVKLNQKIKGGVSIIGVIHNDV